MQEAPHSSQAEAPLYTARVRTVGDRDGGMAQSDDGRLTVVFSPPGGSGSGSNPEQLLAAGWSACFIGAMGLAARKMKVALPPGTADAVEVDLCVQDGEYFLQARHSISLPGLDPAIAREIVETAHRICPYSKATRGNISVVIDLV